MAQDFVPGQRWVSDTELQMGLGTVLATDHRSVTILFLATGETRTYAKATAPLTRGSFGVGDTVKSHEGWSLRITAVQEQQGLLTYIGLRDSDTTTEVALGEGQLDNFIQLNRPTDRLFTAQIDNNKSFDLRYLTRQHINRLAHSELRGLTGCKTSLLAHQLYIAHEVANRFAPRVLLADEVGLGKTIEAGLIIHYQLLTERAQRVLIVVPETLMHQWLVEMLRRFNLHFSLFDEERCLADAESDTQHNAFLNEQLVLCSLEFLLANPQRVEQALAAHWDLLVVDEAHHLQWTPQAASREYLIVEKLARRIGGVLLLTATPEQLGKAGHFARLRLLDADRFPDYASFVIEEQHYQPIAQAVEELIEDRRLSPSAYATLQATVSEGDNQQLLDIVQADTASVEVKQRAREELVNHLLDRHGTGRVLFRNTRQAVKGFPERQLLVYPLPLPERYAATLATFQTAGLSEPRLLLCPELLYQAAGDAGQPLWTEVDPRMSWLTKKLAELRPHKVLVITASADSALDIADTLRLKTGLHAAVFHEGMSIVERDRSAAYFADPDYGSQVLICSEIGSEGRNFQFAHHLVLFDLPLNPDLLEQRIGRLDRIGQTETIKLHIPYIENSAQAVMFHWYHAGLNAFEQTCPVGHTLFTQVKQEVVAALHQHATGVMDIPGLIKKTALLRVELNAALAQGRDRLLEYNSCRPTEAQRLTAWASEQDNSSTLFDYMELIFDCYGVDTEEHSHHSFILRPSEHLQVAFPGLPEDGLIITFDRATALANEDMHFITWEHPMVIDSMDMVVSSELGNTALSALKYRKTKPGTLLLEAVYVLEAISGGELQSNRYLPPTPVRVVVDQAGHDHSGDLPHEQLMTTLITVDNETAAKVVRSQAQKLRALVTLSEQLATRQAPQLLAEAQAKSQKSLTDEVNRLIALRALNPNVRDEEITYFTTQLAALSHAIASAKLRLDALRVIVAM